MNESQLQAALHRLFHEEGHRMVFWNDEGGAFESEVGSVLPADVQLVAMKGRCMLEVKILLEREQPEQKFLVYDTREEPKVESDWLLDMREYAHRFTADRASVMLGELGLQTMALKEHLVARDRFLGSKVRTSKLKALVEPNDTAEDLDRKMLAVLAKAPQAEAHAIVRQLLAQLSNSVTGGLDEIPDGWSDICKLDLEPSFWAMVKQSFGYEVASPSLKGLLLALMATDLMEVIPQSAPAAVGAALKSIENLRLPGRGRRSATVCLAQWRDSQTQGDAYDLLAQEAETALKIDAILAFFPLEALAQVTTFPISEKGVLRGLIEEIRRRWETPDLAGWRALIKCREEGHWARAGVLHAAYQAIKAALNLIESWPPGQGMLHSDSFNGWWALYEKDLWRVDQAYRHFSVAADAVTGDLLKGLRQSVEELYAGYLTELSLGWGEMAGRELDAWKCAHAPNQFQFYAKHVRPRMEESNNAKAMVIVSDAFRYEAAKELIAELNGRYRFEATLSSQLGVLPSYTALGMASLLPHDQLAYSEDGKDIRVDGMSSTGTDNRSTILAKHHGMAIQASELLGLKRDEARARLGGARLVYVYHNQIDATGDNASSEDQVFEATAKAIKELGELVNNAVQHYNFTYVVVTADHGYLFTHDAPEETEKSKLENKPTGTLIAKKRYLLGRNLPPVDNTCLGSTENTAGMKPGSGLDFWIPRGVNLFHFAGGARYFHGGFMPQEIVVPVITIRGLRGGRAEVTRSTAVGLQILGGGHRITTGKHRFQIMQTEAVSERVKPITVKVDIRDGDVPVSDSQTLTFSSASSSLDERLRDVWMTLKPLEFDRRKAYQLVVRDAQTDVTLTHADVQVDRAFSDDF